MAQQTLPNKPQLHRGYHVLPVPGSKTIQLQSEGRAFRLQPLDSSGLLETLLSLLDGARTVDEILAATHSFDRAQVLDSLRCLHQSRLLEDAAPAPDGLSSEQQEFHESQMAFMAHFTVEPHLVQASLAQARVAVLGIGNAGSLLLASLAASGVGSLRGIDLKAHGAADSARTHERVRQECIARNPCARYEATTLADHSSDAVRQTIEGAQLLITVLDCPEPLLLDAVNAACVEARLTWIPVGIRAWEGYVGPSVVPRETACYMCYSLRRKANLENYEAQQLYEDRLKAGATGCTFGCLPQFGPVIAGIAAIEVLRILTHFCAPATYSRMLTVNFLTMNVQFHDVLKLPRCPACGGRSRQLPMIKPWTG